jgi:hypothetical protein
MCFTFDNQPFDFAATYRMTGSLRSPDVLDLVHPGLPQLPT